MENSINKLIEMAGDKTSQIGLYWFLNQLMGNIIYIISLIMVFYLAFTYVKNLMEMARREMLLQERAHDEQIARNILHDEQIARNILSDQEYRNRFKNFPKIAIEEQDKL
jgi:hypothetical protein